MTPASKSPTLISRRAFLQLTSASCLLGVTELAVAQITIDPLLAPPKVLRDKTSISNTDLIVSMELSNLQGTSTELQIKNLSNVPSTTISISVTAADMQIAGLEYHSEYELRARTLRNNTASSWSDAVQICSSLPQPLELKTIALIGNAGIQLIWDADVPPTMPRRSALAFQITRRRAGATLLDLQHIKLPLIGSYLDAGHLIGDEYFGQVVSSMTCSQTGTAFHSAELAATHQVFGIQLDGTLATRHHAILSSGILNLN